MADVRVEVHLAGVHAVRSSASVAEELGRRARAIARAANLASSADTMDREPFAASQDMHPSGAAAHVLTVTPHGWNARNRILNNLGAGR